MAPKKKQDQGQKTFDAANVEWWKHDIYPTAASYSGRIMTRSQTGFVRINNDLSDLQLFCDPARHQPPDLPHLMTTMKGTLGAVPRTIITRSFGQHMEIDKSLVEKLEPYKDFKPDTEQEAKQEADEEAKQESESGNE